MAIDYAFVLKKLRSLKEVHIPYAVATNMPFVTCDEESFKTGGKLCLVLAYTLAFLLQIEKLKSSFLIISVVQNGSP